MINPFNGARMREENFLGIDKQYIFFYFDNQRKRE